MQTFIHTSIYTFANLAARSSAGGTTPGALFWAAGVDDGEAPFAAPFPFAASLAVRSSACGTEPGFVVAEVWPAAVLFCEGGALGEAGPGSALSPSQARRAASLA